MANGYGQVSTNNFSVTRYIVDLNGIQNGATHVTIQAAINSHAINPGVISIKPGTYTVSEDVPDGSEPELVCMLNSRSSTGERILLIKVENLLITASLAKTND